MAGASDRFTFKIEAISYPEQTSSAMDMELAVSGWLPEGEPSPTSDESTNDYMDMLKKYVTS